MSTIERSIEAKPDCCQACHGTGADPMSDTVNSLPCGMCGGTGKARRHTDRQLEQIDALIDSVRQIQRIKHRLREAGIETGSGFSARGLLAFAEDAVRDHLAAINTPGGAK